MQITSVTYPIPNEIVQHILSHSQTLDTLLNTRLTCKMLYFNSNATAQRTWNCLLKNEELSHSLFGTFIKIIEENNGNKSPICKFQKLANHLGIEPKNLPIHGSGLLDLEKNLKIIWKDSLHETLLSLHEEIIWEEGVLPETLESRYLPLPASNATAPQILAFLNEYKPFDEIVSLQCNELGLTTFPSLLLNYFPNLICLYLSENHLKTLELNSDSLQTLDLSNNNFVEIPKINCPNLGYFNLDDNQIEQFEFPNSPKLEDFSLSGNKIKEIPSLTSPTLRSLEISNNHLKSINDVICPQLLKLKVATEGQNDLIQVTGRFHCPQLPPAFTRNLWMDHEGYATNYTLTQAIFEKASQNFCEKRLCQLISQKYPNVRVDPPKRDLMEIVNQFFIVKFQTKFEKITELDFSGMDLKLFPLQLLYWFPNLNVLNLTDNPLIENLEDLENYPHLTVLSDK